MPINRPVSLGSRQYDRLHAHYEKGCEGMRTYGYCITAQLSNFLITENALTRSIRRSSGSHQMGTIVEENRPHALCLSGTKRRLRPAIHAQLILLSITSFLPISNPEPISRLIEWREKQRQPIPFARRFHQLYFCSSLARWRNEFSWLPLGNRRHAFSGHGTEPDDPMTAGGERVSAPRSSERATVTAR